MNGPGGIVSHAIRGCFANHGTPASAPGPGALVSGGRYQDEFWEVGFVAIGVAGDQGVMISARTRYPPQHFLYFLPLPQGQGAFRATRGDALVTGVVAA